MNQHLKKDAVTVRAFKRSRRLVMAILVTILLMLAFVVYKTIN
jgi:uncharacterized membrane protein (UPF0136 family)